MAPFWLEHLELKNFRSFPDSRVAFNRNGMGLIRGSNLDTGGSSYSGKTSIGLGIAMALGYLPFSAKDQRRWGSDGPMYVELGIGTDVGTAIVRAGDKPWFKLPDGRRVTSATAIKEELGRFLGVGPEVLAALTWQRQGKKSRFLSKTDSEKKEFLSNVMPFLTKLERSADQADELVKQIEMSLEGDRKVISHLQSVLTSLVISEPVLTSTDMDLKLLGEIRQGIESTIAQIESVKLELAQQKPDEDLPEILQLRLTRVEAVARHGRQRAMEAAAITEHNAIASKLSRTLHQLQTTISTIPRLESEVDSLAANACPTCQQTWISSQDRLAAAKVSLEQARQAERDLPGLLLQREKHVFVPDPKIEALERMVTKIDGDMARILAEQKVAQQDKYRATTEIQNRLSALQNKLGVQKCDHSDVGHRISVTELENGRRRNDYLRSRGAKEEMSAKLAAAVAATTEQEAKLVAEKDFKALIGRSGFLGSIFDEVLRDITEETNRILASVANTAHVTLNFLSEVSTLKGKINKEIRPVVTIGGNIADLESGASGGMGTSIGLAVDLAVATVISQRTNTWPGWLILDESFEGLDQISKETCLEILKKHSCNRLVLVVDHASETKELFSSFIDVEFQNGESRILNG